MSSASHVLNDSWPDGISISKIEHPIEVWSRVHRWMEEAFDNEWCLMSEVDAFNELLRKTMNLWTIHSKGELVGAFITKVESGSRGHALNLVAVGGENMDDWIAALDETITAYARRNNCRMIAEMGRPGWVKVFGKLGWIIGPPVMIKVL